MLHDQTWSEIIATHSLMGGSGFSPYPTKRETKATKYFCHEKPNLLADLDPLFMIFYLVLLTVYNSSSDR